MPPFRVRPATIADAPFLRLMLYEASYWDASMPRPPIESVDDSVYLTGWRRPGDAGVIVEDDTGTPCGAAWYRPFLVGNPGYGFVNDVTPELAIAVASGHRGRGLGTLLLQSLIDVACEEGHPALSLSVSLSNLARRLYTRFGFQPVSMSGGSETMLLRL